jgi:hypothetical protein
MNRKKGRVTSLNHHNNHKAKAAVVVLEMLIEDQENQTQLIKSVPVLVS